MARLPVPGDDKGTWGDILNTYLQVAHEDDGSLKSIDPALVGLENVDNTSDADKPISDSTQAALDEKADITDLSVTIEENVSTIAATGSTETLSWNTPVHDITLDQNCAVTFSNIAAGKSITVVVRGAFLLTWPATVKWPDMTEPDYTGPAVYTFMSTDGSEVFGFQAGFTMGTA